MIKKSTLTLLLLVLLISALLVLVNWYFIPGARNAGVLTLIGLSIGFSSIFIFGLINAISVLHRLNVEGSKKEPIGYGYQISDTDQFFVGRKKELQELSDNYSRRRKKVFGIHGMGGLGKTTLGIAFANLIKNRYEYQIFLDMRGTAINPVTCQEAMYYVVRSLNPTFAFPKEDHLLVGAYRSILNQHKILMFFDNINDETQIQKLIPPNDCVLIFTSRKRFSMPNSFSMNLPGFSKENARELLLKFTDRLTEEEVEKISELCGFLPSAIVKAGTSLQNYVNISVDNYIVNLSHASSKTGMVEATTSLSFNLLNTKQREFWSRLSIFPGDFGLEAASHVLRSDIQACERILFELHLLSLINVVFVDSKNNDIPGEARFIMHDLDREYANSKLIDRDRKEVENLFVNYYNFVLTKIAFMFHQGGKDMTFAMEAFHKEWKNIEFAHTICSKSHIKDISSAKQCISLGTNGLTIMDISLPQEIIIDWSEVALRAARTIKDVVSEEKILNNLGTAMSNIGKLNESIPFLIRSNEMARDRGDLRGEAESYGNLGNVYRRKGKLETALDYHNKAYAISKENNYEDLQQGDLNNIGNVYLQMLAPAEARKRYELALALARKRGNHNVEVTVLNGIGSSYLYQFRLIQAIKYYRAGLALARKIRAKNLEQVILGNFSYMFGRLWLKAIARKFIRTDDRNQST